MLIEAVLACFWLFFGVLILVIPATMGLWLNILLGVLFLLGAISFLLDALISRPKVAKPTGCATSCTGETGKPQSKEVCAASSNSAHIT